jgi:poly-gamma-glutamate synthase PgsB/CapB
MAPVTLLILTLLWIGYLAVERTQLARARKAVPLRIAVTGTRGKSTVARMLASVLRMSGRTVLAKTTGSEAALILPDGTEREVRRRGRPSIIEQKRVIRLGARLGADTLVAEIMSVHPEMHDVETGHLVRPTMVMVTNFRVDHPAAQGDTPEAVANVLGLDVLPDAPVLVPEEECLPAFEDRVREAGGKLVRVEPAVESSLSGGEEGRIDFRPNLDLVWAAARFLGVSDEAIGEGISRTQGDLGALRVWRYEPGSSDAPCFVVNAFAANDPESTLQAHDRALEALPFPPQRYAGVLNLRADRGDRTLLWLKALDGGALSRFGRLYLCGLHARALKRRLGRSEKGCGVEVLSPGEPAKMMETVTAGFGVPGGVVFGFGNIGGPGKKLVKHWQEAGEPVAKHEFGEGWPDGT